MSLVINVLTEKYCVFCADQRRIIDGNSIDEDYRKIFKINDNCILGMAGDLEYIDMLTSSIVEYRNKEVICMEAIKKTYTEINEIIQKHFHELKKVIETETEDGEDYDGYTKKQRSFVSLGGYDGSIMRMDNYSFVGATAKESHYLSPPETFRFFSMHNNDSHCDYFLERINTYSNKALTILNVKNAFKDTLEKGIKIDDSINNKPIFETIRRCDVKLE